jgi:hypothetical protein
MGGERVDVHNGIQSLPHQSRYPVSQEEKDQLPAPMGLCARLRSQRTRPYATHLKPGKTDVRTGLAQPEIECLSVLTLLRENELKAKGKYRKGPAQPARIDVYHVGTAVSRER